MAAAAAAVISTATGCGPQGTVPRGVIAAVCAENTYASVLSQIGGRYVHVTALLENPNTDPHTFEASPGIAREVSSAQLIVQNGLGYDSWINKIESAAPRAGRKVIVAQHVLGLPDTTPNPHLWYSPATMPAVARAMAADLAALQPAHRRYFQARQAAFGRSLGPWRRGIAQFAATHHGVTAATTEPVADYLLAAMKIANLTPFRFQAAVMNGVDPAPQDIAAQNALFRQHRVAVFLYNEQVTDALTASIRQNALSAGVPAVAVYETMPPGYTYQSWMLAELHAIAVAVTRHTSTPKL